MSYLIVSIEPELEEKVVVIVARNWIIEEQLYIPSKAFSSGYKKKFLKCRTTPDKAKWDCHELFEVKGLYGNKHFDIFTFS